MEQGEHIQRSETFASTQVDVNSAGWYGVTLSVEMLLYTGLAVIVFLLRVLGLGDVPLTLPEIPRALAAWQVVNPNSMVTILPDSALLQLSHILSFSLIGANEIAVRIATAIVGTLLVFSPLLFRTLLGKTRTLVMVVLLSVSPVLLASTRLDSPVVWETLFAVLALWAMWRYVASQVSFFAVVATIFLSGGVLLAGPTGYLLPLIIILSFVLAGRLVQMRYMPDAEVPNIVDYIRKWPWVYGLSISTLIVLSISTLFMFYPAGLNAVGQALGVGLAGWIQPQPDAPAFWGFLSSLIYEIPYWFFALVGVFSIFNRDRISFVDGFFVSWFVVVSVILLVYSGTTQAHALWLTIALVGLVAHVVEHLLDDDMGVLWYQDEGGMNSVFGWSIPAWTRWVVLTIAVFLFSLVLMHSGVFFRTLATTSFSVETMAVLERIGPPLLILLVLVTLLFFLGFTMASVYGLQVTLRGSALGLLAVSMVALLGSGWRIAYSHATDPLEFWHARAADKSIFVLRQTLLDLAERESGGFPVLDITVVEPENDLETTNVVRWILRDFTNVQYVNSLPFARGQEILLIPDLAEAPDLGGSYVGQRFVLTQDWNMDVLTVQSFFVWWFQRDTSVIPSPIPTQPVVLWLRQDIYNGIPFPGLQP